MSDAYRSQWRLPFVLLTGLVGALGCTDSHGTSPTTPDVPAQHVQPAPSVPQALLLSQPRVDDAWSALAQEIPGFAGFFVDADDRAIVMTSTAASRSLAEDAVLAHFEGSGASPSGIVYREVAYSAAQLSQWTDTLIPLLGSTVLMTDLDEVANRVFVGIDRGADRNEVEAALAERGIPEDAYSIGIIERAREDTQYLDSSRRPTIAGLRLDVGPYYCTLGFNTTYAGNNALVTASHCSNSPFSSSPDSTLWEQRAPYDVAFEVLDRALASGYVYFNAAGRGYACSGGCRFSDTQISEYYDTVNVRQGLIARTTWYSSSAAPGSKTINSSDSTFVVVDKLPFPDAFVGLGVSKIGATTGWTRGTIQRTCVNVAFTSSVQLCNHEASYFRAGGDSGAPVFVDGGVTLPPDFGVELAGTHVGQSPANPNRGIFCTIEGAEDDLGVTLPVWLAPLDLC